MAMSMRERRQRGLTLRNMIRVSRQLRDSGALTKDMSDDDMAETILEAIVTEDPKAFSEVGIDFDAILEFIKKWLPVIMAIIALF
jgi:hypothetical protein